MLCADENISFTHSFWVSILVNAVRALFSLASSVNSGAKPKHFDEPNERRSGGRGERSGEEVRRDHSGLVRLVSTWGFK